MTKAIVRQRDFRPGCTDVTLYETSVGNERARFAAELLSRLAIITAETDGEDSAGRQKCRLMTPEECAQRAADISDAAFNEFEKRNWMIDIPEPTEAPPEPPVSLACRSRSGADLPDAPQTPK